MNAENSDEQFQLEYRDLVSMKGKKDPMKVWFLSRKSKETEIWFIKEQFIILNINSGEKSLIW